MCVINFKVLDSKKLISRGLSGKMPKDSSETLYLNQVKPYEEDKIMPTVIKRRDNGLEAVIGHLDDDGCLS